MIDAPLCVRQFMVSLNNQKILGKANRFPLSRCLQSGRGRPTDHPFWSDSFFTALARESVSFLQSWKPPYTGHVPSLSGGKMIPKTTFLPTELPFRRRPPGVPARRPRETVEPRPAARRAGCMWGLLRSGGGCSWSQALARPPVGSLGPRAPAAESLEWIGKRRPTCPELTIFLSRWLQLTRRREPTGPWAGGKTPRWVRTRSKRGEAAQPGGCSPPTSPRRAARCGAHLSACARRCGRRRTGPLPAGRGLPGLESTSDPCRRLGFWPAPCVHFPAGTKVAHFPPRDPWPLFEKI